MWNSNRLKEPSTWAGIAAVLQGLKLVMPPQWHAVLDGITIAAGGVAVARKDPGAEK